MPEIKLNYASPARPGEAKPLFANRHDWAATPALCAGCGSLLADALTAWGLQSQASFAGFTMLAAMVLPFVGIVLAALGLGASGIGILSGGVVFIMYLFANMPNC